MKVNFGVECKQSARIGFWMLLLVFSAIYLMLRLPWITGDPGIPSVWEYGYNATDEGYYLAGGKEKFLWGAFVDLPRHEAFTYGFSAGTHYLSFLAHRLFGLSTWSWRVPFVAVYLCGWLAMFVYIAKRAGAYVSFALCTAISIVPMVVAYERTASNDALISALLVLSYVCATGRTWWRVVAAAFLSASIVLIKPSVWVLLPIVAAGVAEEGLLRMNIKRILVFVIAAIVGIFAWKVIVALIAIPDAERAGVSMWELVRKTTTHYPLPPIFDFLSHFKGFSSFPRDPSIQLLGGLTALVFPLPLAMAARGLLGKRFNGHFLLFLAVPAYIAAVSVMNTIYTHYFFPAIVILPIVFLALLREFPAERLDWKNMTKSLQAVFVMVALCVIVLFILATWSLSPSVSQMFYSKIYNLPQRNVWGMAWPVMVAPVLTVAVVAAIRGCRTGGAGKAALYACVTAAVAFVAVSVVTAALPAVMIAPYMKKSSAEYFAPMAVSFVMIAVLFSVLFGWVRGLPRGKVAVSLLPVCVLSSYIVTPNWRSSFCELLSPATYYHKQAANDIAVLLPRNAIVIGERSNQMLMSLPIRTATTFAANSDPIPVIESILKVEPDARLYALADSQHAYNLQHYRKHGDKYRLRLVKILKMPSFGTGALADVYLCEIVTGNL